MEILNILRTLDAPDQPAAAERAFAKGQYLFRRGDAPQFMFYIFAGEARLMRTSPTGAEIVFQRTGRGFLAEASLDQPAYHCDGLAAVDTKALAIPLARFRAGLAQAEFRAIWLAHLGGELRRVRAHSERLALRTARERIVHYIETEGRDGQLHLPHSKKIWAAEMGLTHEALYRTLKQMTAAGLLEVSDARVLLRYSRDA